jgi:hypothetical protein
MDSAKIVYVPDSIGNIDKIIARKIQKYKFQDKNNKKLINFTITDDYVSVDDVKQLLINQENKCYVCYDTVVTKEWQSRCLYQFTLDRIDEKLPHNKNNVLICCYYCNCISPPASTNIDDSDCDVFFKLCESKCHTVKKYITRKRYYIPKEEIIGFLINII